MYKVNDSVVIGRCAHKPNLEGQQGSVIRAYLDPKLGRMYWIHFPCIPSEYGGGGERQIVPHAFKDLVEAMMHGELFRFFKGEKVRVSGSASENHRSFVGDVGIVSRAGFDGARKLYHVEFLDAGVEFEESELKREEEA